MALRIVIASDFVCPYCFWLEALLERVRGRMELEVEHLPFELTERPEPREDVWNDPERRARYAQTLGPVCRELGLDMKLPPHVVPRPYTDLAFRGWYFAREQGCGEQYFRLVFQAYFQQERDIGDPRVLAEAAREAGMDREAFLRALDQKTYDERERQAVRRAREELRVCMVPTVFAAGERLEGFVRSEEELEAWLRRMAEQEPQ